MAVYPTILTPTPMHDDPEVLILNATENMLCLFENSDVDDLTEAQQMALRKQLLKEYQARLPELWKFFRSDAGYFRQFVQIFNQDLNANAQLRADVIEKLITENKTTLLSCLEKNAIFSWLELQSFSKFVRAAVHAEAVESFDWLFDTTRKFSRIQHQFFTSNRYLAELVSSLVVDENVLFIEALSAKFDQFVTEIQKDASASSEAASTHFRSALRACAETLIRKEDFSNLLVCFDAFIRYFDVNSMLHIFWFANQQMQTEPHRRQFIEIFIERIPELMPTAFVKEVLFDTRLAEEFVVLFILLYYQLPVFSDAANKYYQYENSFVRWNVLQLLQPGTSCFRTTAQLLADARLQEPNFEKTRAPHFDLKQRLLAAVCASVPTR